MVCFWNQYFFLPKQYENLSFFNTMLKITENRNRNKVENEKMSVT